MPIRNDSPEYIEDQIAETRARFDRHASQLSTSLAPDRLFNDAIGARSDAPADTLDALVHAARSAPVSFLLAGVGLAGILMNNQKRTVTRDHPLPVATDPAERTGNHLHALKAQASSLADGVGDAVDTLQDKAGALVSGATDTASGAGRSASTYADSAYRSGVAGYKISRNHAAHYARHAPETGARMAGDAGSWVRDNPVTAGLAALAVGAAAASFLAYRNDDERHDDAFDHHEDFPPSPDPTVAPRKTTVAQAKPRKPSTAGTSAPSSPDVSSAIPKGRSKVGSNVIASTSVLGVAEDEKKD